MGGNNNVKVQIWSITNRLKGAKSLHLGTSIHIKYDEVRPDRLEQIGSSVGPKGAHHDEEVKEPEACVADIARDINLREEDRDPMTPTLPYLIEDDFLYSVQEDGSNWLCVPTSLAKDIFQLVHDDQGHQGFDRCRRKMDGIVIHKGMRLLRRYIDHCPECLRNNTRRHRPYRSLQPIIGLPIPFHTVYIDFFVGLPVFREGYNAIAFITCKFTKGIGAISGENTRKSKDWALTVLAHL
ncbi:hypothetical protein N7527_001293 [Penicillium freii]|nr:hypothetical protein N7527_001293 [Penicillium freii]